mmetsp:Transcript_16820/g.64049  ORF Transcript_16820/g.64049 Transcript_16820/m.64049 type:complete len:419 (+) Transcript_16820:1120-2376(+)
MAIWRFHISQGVHACTPGLRSVSFSGGASRRRGVSAAIRPKPPREAPHGQAALPGLHEHGGALQTAYLGASQSIRRERFHRVGAHHLGAAEELGWEPVARQAHEERVVRGLYHPEGRGPFHRGGCVEGNAQRAASCGEEAENAPVATDKAGDDAAPGCEERPLIVFYVVDGGRLPSLLNGWDRRAFSSQRHGATRPQQVTRQSHAREDAREGDERVEVPRRPLRKEAKNVEAAQPASHFVHQAVSQLLLQLQPPLFLALGVAGPNGVRRAGKQGVHVGEDAHGLRVPFLLPHFHPKPQRARAGQDRRHAHVAIGVAWLHQELILATRGHAKQAHVPAADHGAIANDDGELLPREQLPVTGMLEALVVDDDDVAVDERIRIRWGTLQHFPQDAPVSRQVLEALQRICRQRALFSADVCV